MITVAWWIVAVSAALSFFLGWSLGSVAQDKKWTAVARRNAPNQRWSDSMWIWGRRYFVVEHGDLKHAEDLVIMQRAAHRMHRDEDTRG